MQVPQNANGMLATLNGAAITAYVYSEKMTQAVALIMNYLAKHSTAIGRATGTHLHTLGSVAIPKRGTISNVSLATINRAVSDEAHYATDISKDEIESFAASMMPFISETSAESILRRLHMGFRPYSLHLHIT